MTTIILTTPIRSPIETVFDLSLDIDFHKKSASKTLETVTWRGKHFGVFLTHTSLISAYNRPITFTDEMIKGHFKSFKHVHTFETSEGITIAKDVLSYQAPYGLFGRLFDLLFLKHHLIKFLKIRNLTIKSSLEG